MQALACSSLFSLSLQAPAVSSFSSARVSSRLYQAFESRGSAGSTVLRHGTPTGAGLFLADPGLGFAVLNRGEMRSIAGLRLRPPPATAAHFSIGAARARRPSVRPSASQDQAAAYYQWLPASAKHTKRLPAIHHPPSTMFASNGAGRPDLAGLRRQRLAQQQQRRALLAGDGAGAALTSPLGAPVHEQTCKYKSGKCSNPRATKRNGQLHTLCSFHRMRQNEHQRKSDRKHRLYNVSRRAKLGSLGLSADSQSLHSILSLASAFPLGQHPPAVVPIDAHDQNLADALRNAQLSAPPAPLAPSAAAAAAMPAQPTARLPPISYLTGKLDGYRASSSIPALSRRA